MRLQVYLHRLAGPEEVVEWMKGSLLTDYRKRLTPEAVRGLPGGLPGPAPGGAAGRASPPATPSSGCSCGGGMGARGRGGARRLATMAHFESSENGKYGGLRDIRFRLGETPGRLWLPDCRGRRAAAGADPAPRHEQQGRRDRGGSGAGVGDYASLGLPGSGRARPRRASGSRPVRGHARPGAGGGDGGAVRGGGGGGGRRAGGAVCRSTRGSLGYYGYSLGAMLGVPAVAGDGRFRAAVFAAAGNGGAERGGGGRRAATSAGLGDVAVRVIAKERDEVVSPDATMELYAGLPGEKDLVTLPGGHFAIGGRRGGGGGGVAGRRSCSGRYRWSWPSLKLSQVTTRSGSRTTQRRVRPAAVAAWRPSGWPYFSPIWRRASSRWGVGVLGFGVLEHGGAALEHDALELWVAFVLVDEDGGDGVTSQVGDLLAAAGGVDLTSGPAEPEGP